MKLKVKIPKKYKKDLSFRFNPRNAEKKMIKKECPLCREYHFFCTSNKGQCPFFKFDSSPVFLPLGDKGCEKWVEKVMKKEVRFKQNLDGIFLKQRGAKADLLEFRKKAKELIEWV